MYTHFNLRSVLSVFSLIFSNKMNLIVFSNNYRNMRSSFYYALFVSIKIHIKCKKNNPKLHASNSGAFDLFNKKQNSEFIIFSLCQLSQTDYIRKNSTNWLTEFLSKTDYILLNTEISSLIVLIIIAINFKSSKFEGVG